MASPNKDLTMAEAGRSRLRDALRIVAVWLAVALLFLPQFLMLNASKPQPDPLPVVLYGNLVVFGLWAALTPLVLRLAARWPIERRRAAPRIATHMLFATGVSLMHLGVMALLLWPTLPDGVPMDRLFVSLAVGTEATNMLLYFGVLAAGHALSYLARYQASERAHAQARLSALRAQLHPHFLFNTLNALSELVHRDAALADRLILRLADLLRRTLAGSGAHEVTLAEELDFTRAYLDIQQALMGDRLRTRFDVPTALLAARVPNMLLQPLIENAIRHGLSARRRGGALQVAARIDDDGGALLIDVTDDGAGPPPGHREGIGLGNTRARLATLYGDAAGLDVEPLAPGFRARVRLPLHLTTRTADDPPAHADR